MTQWSVIARHKPNSVSQLVWSESRHSKIIGLSVFAECVSQTSMRGGLIQVIESGQDRQSAFFRLSANFSCGSPW
jgi:hypothetical protein